MIYSIIKQLFERSGHHYILLMMLGTRIFGSVGGLLVIYYVELALRLPDSVRMHFRVASVVLVILGCTLTVLLALWETRGLRSVLKRLGRGETVPPEQASQAGQEAVMFVGRHHWREAWLVPCSTLVPMLIFLRLMDHASTNVLVSVTLTVFMGIAMALMGTFFAVEMSMKPVIRWLLSHGVNIQYESLPIGRIQFRFGLCSALIIMVSALMIGTLARQRAADIITDIANQEASVANLKSHSIYITIAAVATGLIFSQVLGHSVASRVGKIVKAMERVGSGSMTERLHPTGNDEIDALARRFNDMVHKLETNQQTIQDLNISLEQKVSDRTRRLEHTLQELRNTQNMLTDTARRAGMAEIATGVLHNVGNVLNSVNISTTCLTDQVRKSKLLDLQRTVKQLETQPLGVDNFLSTEGRSEKLLAYLLTVTEKLADERENLQLELSRLTEKVGHVKDIVNTQQRYAKRVRCPEPVSMVALVDEVLAMHRHAIDNYGVEVITRFRDVPVAMLEKTNVLQMLDNLIKNAVEAMLGHPRRILTVEVSLEDGDRVVVSVSDTGCGIAKADMANVFSYGFTTKANGNGFGLHSSALAISAIGGAIRVHSDGPGEGTTFTFKIPLNPASDPTAVSPADHSLLAVHS